MSICLNDLQPEALLRRRDLAQALTARGFPMTEATLATKVSRPGRWGGPPYRLFGRVPLYRWGDALAWAEGCLSPPRRDTPEVDTGQFSAPRRGL